MAQIIGNDGGGHSKGGKKRPKKHGTPIDMTPMVDLMCLLITFFMLTTAFAKPKVMEIVLPEKNKDTTKIKSPEIPASRTLNVIIDEKNQVWWYMGVFNPAKKDEAPPKIARTDFSKDGIRKILLEKNKELFIAIDDIKSGVSKGTINPLTIIPKDSLVKLKKEKDDNDIINLYITSEIKKLKSKDEKGPIVLIKAVQDKAKYRDFVNIIDEMAIANIARYAVVDVTPNDMLLLNAAKGIAPPPSEDKTKK